MKLGVQPLMKGRRLQRILAKPGICSGDSKLGGLESSRGGRGKKEGKPDSGQRPVREHPLPSSQG